MHAAQPRLLGLLHLEDVPVSRRKGRTPRQAEYRRELKATRLLYDPTTPLAEREEARKIVREAAEVRDEKRRERQAVQRDNHVSRGGRAGELAAIDAFLADQADARGHAPVRIADRPSSNPDHRPQSRRGAPRQSRPKMGRSQGGGGSV